ncbi:MAG: sensor domain-containing diguanylate cyclase [Spirochaetes bacterium]|nr:sensor domain-containing diguanylate cyclase [Spirochaetota bacterium]
MEKTAQLLNVLHDFSENLLNTNYAKIDNLYSLTVLYCAEFLKCDRASFLRYNREEDFLYHGNTAQFTAAREIVSGVDATLKHITIPFTADFRHAVRDHGDLVVVSDPAQHYMLSPAIDDMLGIQAKHMLIIPLILNDEFVGVIEAVRGGAETDAFDAVDQIFFVTLINFIVTLLSGIRSSDWAIRDTLTGAFNVGYFKQACEHLINDQNRRRSQIVNNFCVAMIDVDDFKKVNDRYGHHAGDAVLLHCVNAITSCLRKDDILARYGGDEFSVIFRACPLSNVSIACERILSHMRNEKIIVDGNEIIQTMSIGVAEFSTHGTQRDDVMRHADIAMYQSKKRGKNCFTIYAPGMEVDASAPH